MRLRKSKIGMRLRWAGTVLCLAALLSCGGRQGPAGPQTLSLPTADGLSLGALLYPCAGEQPPGLLLVHRFAADRAVWHPFAERARGRGYLVLALDLRGHGASTQQNGKTIAYASLSDAGWAAAVGDLEAGLAALRAHGADPQNLAIMGEGLGANLALRYALEDPSIQTLVLLSPGIALKGFDAESDIGRLRNRPVLLVAAEGDDYGASSARALKAAAPGFAELRTYNGAAMGADLFATTPHALGQVMLWLDDLIGPRRLQTQDPKP